MEQQLKDLTEQTFNEYSVPIFS